MPGTPSPPRFIPGTRSTRTPSTPSRTLWRPCRLRYRRRLRSTEARKRRRRRRGARRRRHTFARRSPRSAARNQRRPRTSRSRRRTPNVPSPSSPTETHKGRAIYSTRCSRLRRRRVGATAPDRRQTRAWAEARTHTHSAFTGWTGGSAAQPHASLPATAAPGAAVQPTADQLALAMMLYGYAGAAGVSPSGIPPAGIPPAIPPKAEEAEPAATRDQRAARSAKEKGKAAVTDPEPRDVDGDEGSDGGGSGGSGGSGGGGSGGSGSGERGSGNSDQTKATRRSDPLPKRSSRGFESSSQREASPPERLR